jgi:hypothetical protein
VNTFDTSNICTTLPSATAAMANAATPNVGSATSRGADTVCPVRCPVRNAGGR